MKTVKFSPDLVPLVLSGEKTVTWRMFDTKDLSMNDRLEFVNSMSGEVFGYAEIISVYEKKFKEISDEDLDGHEKFPSREVMLETYRKYYGEKVDNDTIVKIIHFIFTQR